MIRESESAQQRADVIWKRLHGLFAYGIGDEYQTEQDLDEIENELNWRRSLISAKIVNVLNTNFR